MYYVKLTIVNDDDGGDDDNDDDDDEKGIWVQCEMLNVPSCPTENQGVVLPTLRGNPGWGAEAWPLGAGR